MKKTLKLFLLPLVMMAGLMIVTKACSKDDDDFTCETIELLEETVEACCNSKECYYEWNGVKYWCDGKNCEDAAERLVYDMLGWKTETEVCKDQLIEKLLYR